MANFHTTQIHLELSHHLPWDMTVIIRNYIIPHPCSADILKRITFNDVSLMTFTKFAEYSSSYRGMHKNTRYTYSNSVLYCKMNIYYCLINRRRKTNICISEEWVDGFKQMMIIKSEIEK